MKIDNSITVENLRKEIGRRIANRRMLHRLTQSELAERSGISRFCLSRLENGVGGIGFDSVLTVWRHLDLLPGLNMALPEPTVPLQELVRYEQRGRVKLPQRFRAKRKKPEDGKHLRVWGNGKAIGGGHAERD